MGFSKGIGYGILTFIGGFFAFLIMPKYWFFLLCIFPLLALGIGLVENPRQMEKHFVVVQQTPEIPLNTNYSHQERTFPKIEYENSDNLPPKTHIRAIVGNDKSRK